MDWIKSNWKYIAVVVAAVVILSAVIIVFMLGQSSGSVVGAMPPDGPETGVYYYDAAAG